MLWFNACSWSRLVWCSPLVGSSVSVPVLHPPVQLDIAPCFADDGLLAGLSVPSNIGKACYHNWPFGFPVLLLPQLPPSATLIFSPFSHLDIILLLRGHYEVLKSPSVSDAYCRTFCTERADHQIALLQRLPHLPDVQVGYYLMRWSCAAGRM